MLCVAYPMSARDWCALSVRVLPPAPGVAPSGTAAVESSEDWATEDEDEREAYVSGRRLWDANALHPSGLKNWRDARNCEAALAYDCPCGKKCLSHIGGTIALYEHRRALHTAIAKRSSGGMRTILREKLREHFDASLGTFTDSFVVGEYGQVCDRAYAVASALSEATFVRARADVTKGRSVERNRPTKRKERDNTDRRILEGWVRMQREGMEGDKKTGSTWYTEKTTERQLWRRYLSSCDCANQPSVGSSRLLFQIWKSHKEIKERAPTGHAICSTCGLLDVEHASLEGLNDPSSNQARQEIQAKQAAHKAFHLTERKYYEDAATRAFYVPTDVTTLTIDAPTVHQFDLPSQARARRDTVKKLDGTSRWKSKLEGVLDAGIVVHS